MIRYDRSADDMFASAAISSRAARAPKIKFWLHKRINEIFPFSLLLLRNIQDVEENDELDDEELFDDVVRAQDVTGKAVKDDERDHGPSQAEALEGNQVQERRSKIYVPCEQLKVLQAGLDNVQMFANTKDEETLVYLKKTNRGLDYDKLDDKAVDNEKSVPVGAR